MIDLKRFKARHDKRLWDIDLYNLRGKYLKSFCVTVFSRKFPILAKQIKAAKGKCVDIQISMEVVE